MALAPGTRLGPYEVIVQIGVGGMGEVYRATDTNLKRNVAIKVLPEAVATDDERLARFQREAELLARLNHPNIAHIHGLEKSAGTTALVMELVEGPTLADRIAQGPIPVDEALPIAQQIAEALEAAHEQGIIHRDLKPSNIKVRGDGSVKVLDFGLAKAMEPANALSGNSTPSTITTPAMTQMGMVLGTAAYMSPEQAKGKPIDKRADIWAFGCVLFEMLTGKRAFAGEDVSDTLAFVLTKEVDWNALPGDTSPVIRRLLRRCLEKDHKRRLRDIGDARLELTEPTAAVGAESIPSLPGFRASRARHAAIILATAVVTVAATVIVSFLLTRHVDEPRQVRRFTLAMMTRSSTLAALGNPSLAIAMDGTTLAYIGANAQMYLRRFNALDATPMLGIGSVAAPFFSRDGRWVGFFTAAVGPGQMRKVSVLGGPPVAIAPIRDLPRGASWAPDDTIVFATSDRTTGLLRVPSAGGTPKVLTTPDAKQGEIDHVWPDVLPHGRAVLFTILTTGEASSLAVVDLQSGEHKVLVRGGTHGQYAPSGHIVYGVAGTLRALPFDPERLEVLGDPVPVLDGVSSTTEGAMNAALSQEGTLVYIPASVSGGTQRTLAWVDRQGRENPIASEPRVYSVPRVSPDGTRIVSHVDESAAVDVMVLDLRRQTTLRLTFGKGTNSRAAWSLDSQWVYFQSDADGAGIYRTPANGTGAIERVAPTSREAAVHSFTPDGKTMIVPQIGATTGRDLWMIDVDGNRTPRPLVVEPGDQSNAVISADGRWLAYHSAERGEIHVRPFPNVAGGRWLVAAAGAKWPLWSRDGRELFYVNSKGLASIAIDPAGGTLQWSPERLLFEASYSGWPGLAGPRNYDLAPDGRHFVVIKEPNKAQLTDNIVVVENWTEELKRLLRPK